MQLVIIHEKNQLLLTNEKNSTKNLCLEVSAMNL